MKRRICALGLVLIMLFTLAACGGEDTSTDEQDTDLQEAEDQGAANQDTEDQDAVNQNTDEAMEPEGEDEPDSSTEDEQKTEPVEEGSDSEEREEPDSDSDKEGESADVTEPEEETINPEYVAVFADLGLTAAESTFATTDYAAFATVTVDGDVDEQEFGYENGIVSYMTENMWLYYEGLTEDDRDATIESYREVFSAFDEIDTVTYDFTWEGNYLHMTLAVSALDDTDNLMTLADYGIISMTDEEDPYMYFEETEEELITAGYVKR